MAWGRTKGRLRVPLAMAAAATLAAGCSAGVGAAQASSKHASSGSTSHAVKVAKAQLDKYKGIPKFVPPNAPFKTSSLKGKTVALVAISMSATVPATIVQAAQQAAAAVGMHTTVFNSKGEPSLMTEGVSQAVGAHDGAILLIGVPVGLVTAQLKAAKAAGIPVVSVANNQPKASAPGQGGGPDLFANASENLNLEGRLAADEAIVQTKGHAKAILMNAPGLTPAPPVLAGLKSVLRSCRGCSVVTQTTTPIQTWTTKVGPLTTSTLHTDPAANVVLPILNTMALFVVPAIQSANATHPITVDSVGATSASAQLMVKDPKILTGLAANSSDWAAWLAMNQAMRGMEHLKPGNPVVPARFVVPASVKKGGTSDAGLYGTSYVTGFEKLWGVRSGH